jgi:hypothetical protein
MSFADIAAGDIVRCSAGGRVFHAAVRGHVPGGITITPLERGITARRVSERDVIDHWAHRGRPAPAPAEELHPEQRSLGDLWDR